MAGFGCEVNTPNLEARTSVVQSPEDATKPQEVEFLGLLVDYRKELSCTGLASGI